MLLNGKEFFDGHDNLMFGNRGAYTVRDIQVYEGESKDSRRHMSIDIQRPYGLLFQCPSPVTPSPRYNT
ncbi:MAG: hypothetical protein K2I52_06575, partial [Muribaculaceae bacterium]|nr:hypothetical protein [Muribaculaceae bacterium]